MVRICGEVPSENGGAGDRTLFERHERSGVACPSYDQTTAILPSVLNPVFETVTGEAPASFSLSPRPDEMRVS